MTRMTRNKFFLTIFYLLIFAVNFQNSSRAQELIPTLQIITLKINNGQVVWTYYDGQDTEIAFYDGVSTCLLTNDAYNDSSPGIDNGQVVWRGYDSKIYLYNNNNAQTIQLANTAYYNAFPQIHNGQVTWQGYDGHDWEIFFYNGAQTILLTNNDYDDWFPVIHNGQIAWQGCNDEIYLYNGAQTIQLANTVYGSKFPQIHNGQVTWQGHDGHDWEIFLYNGAQTIPLTNNGDDDWAPVIHSGQVAWQDGGSNKIYLYKDGQPILLTVDNNFAAYPPQISNGQVVWIGADDSGSSQIFLYNGVNTTQLTIDNTFKTNPHIHNGKIVWVGQDDQGLRIFLYNGVKTIELREKRSVEIDPGHGKDPVRNVYNQRGTSPTYGIYEDEFNIWLGLELRAKFKPDVYTIHMTRTSIYDLFSLTKKKGKLSNANTLKERVRLANLQHKPKPEIFVSIHCNASDNYKANGTETFYYAPSVKGKKLADKIHTELVKIGLRNRGIKDDTQTAGGSSYVIRNTSMPAIIVETAFFTNNILNQGQAITDENRLYYVNKRAEAVNAIYNGIKEYFKK